MILGKIVVGIEKDHSRINLLTLYPFNLQLKLAKVELLRFRLKKSDNFITASDTKGSLSYISTWVAPLTRSTPAKPHVVAYYADKLSISPHLSLSTKPFKVFCINFAV